MKLDFFNSGKNSGKVSRQLDHDGLVAVLQEPRLRQLVDAYRNGDAEAKKQLPCICYMGQSTTGRRKAAEMQPTGLVMIDIDHCADPRQCYQHVLDHLGSMELLMAHITPSGKGLRLVLRGLEGCESIEQNLQTMAEQLQVGDYGDLDTCCKDLSRVSFLVPADEVLKLSSDLFTDGQVYISSDFAADESSATAPIKAGKPSETDGTIHFDDDHQYDDYEYNGYKVRDIIARYIEQEYPTTKQPPVGQRHTFYNKLVTNFRYICDNNPAILHALLPDFCGEPKETRKQCLSICQRNFVSQIPTPFYAFLVKNGYVKDYKTETRINEAEEELEQNPNAERDALLARCPKQIPPVFREFMNTAPDDFKIATVFALEPILGTLTSYLGAYYDDGEYHTTSFFSVIYAPPSSGKSFCKKMYDRLTQTLENRDLISAARENLYNTIVNRKGSNEKSPEDPRVSCRIMPAINSLPEVLIKQRNNQGYHMLTFTEEMDTWKKGSKAQGDKNDLYRIAWDNGKYGQAFKSTGTFKGIVQLYWNVLCTGTPRQVRSYFNDVENGMVTRCGFCDLGDQQFAEKPVFKPLSQRDIEVINRFMARCDENSYTEPLAFDVNRLYDIKDEDFDQEVPWRYEFRQRQTVEMSWMYKPINDWCKQQRQLARQSMSDAWDVFFRRVAVRGFRLALLCTALYPRIGEKERTIIRDFCLWVMDCDICEIRKLFEDEYNEMKLSSQKKQKKGRHTDLYSMLPDEFDMHQLLEAMSQAGVNSPVYLVIHRWMDAGMIEKAGKGHFRKTGGGRSAKRR